MSTLSACLLSVLVYLSCMPAADAARAPRWSIAMKGGLFAPGLSDWERQYDAAQATILGMALGFKLTSRLEIGVEGAYFSDKGKAVTTSGRPSGVNQKFQLIPVQAYLIYQLAFHKDQAWVPYLGGGYSRFVYRTALTDAQTVKGAQEGYHFRWGLALLLDHFDTRAARRSEQWGLDNSYLFFEAQYAEIDDFGRSSIDLGGWTYSSGLRYEF